MVKLSVVYLDDIFGTAQPFVTKLGITVHQCGAECHAKQ